MDKYILRYRYLARSKDGQTADSIENDYTFFNDENKETVNKILSLPDGESFEIEVDGTLGVTIIENNKPFEYFRDSKEDDKRLCTAIKYALLDLKNNESGLNKKLYSKYAEDISLLDFAMSVVNTILTRKAISGYFDGPSTRICAKAYLSESDRYLEPYRYKNYFTFDLDKNIWPDSIKSLNPLDGDYLIKETIEELNKEYILKYVVPAFYYSLNFANTCDYAVRDMFSYYLELA